MADAAEKAKSDRSPLSGKGLDVSPPLSFDRERIVTTLGSSHDGDASGKATLRDNRIGSELAACNRRRWMKATSRELRGSIELDGDLGQS
jgi:hypothetical protein